MAGASSRLGAKTLLQNCRRWIFSESCLSGDVLPVLGDSGGGNRAFRVGSIGRATFDAFAADKHTLVGSESSCRTRFFPEVKFELSAKDGTFSETTCGNLGFSRRCSSQSTSAAPQGRPLIFRSAADGSQKVIARIINVPKSVFKSDLLWLLKGCNLSPEDFLYVYDSKYRLKFIQMQLPSVESFQLAQRTVASKGRLGGRYVRLISEEFAMDDVNTVLVPFRGRSLVMMKLQFGVTTEDVERFFSGYTLDFNYPIKFLRSPLQAPVKGNQGSMAQMQTEYEMRALVRFRTELEALRAMREKQGAICIEKPVDLRFIS